MTDYEYMFSKRDWFIEKSFCALEPLSAAQWRAVLQVLARAKLALQFKAEGPHVSAAAMTDGGGGGGGGDFYKCWDAPAHIPCPCRWLTPPLCSRCLCCCLQTAVGRVGANATAFPWRTALFCSQLGSNKFKSAADGAKAKAALRPVQAALQRILGTTAAYINYIDRDVSDNPLASYYGNNLQWLRRVKLQYDPTNFFGTNPLALPPAGALG